VNTFGRDVFKRSFRGSATTSDEHVAVKLSTCSTVSKTNCTRNTVQYKKTENNRPYSRGNKRSDYYYYYARRVRRCAERGRTSGRMVDNCFVKMSTRFSNVVYMSKNPSNRIRRRKLAVKSSLGVPVDHFRHSNGPHHEHPEKFVVDAFVRSWKWEMIAYGQNRAFKLALRSANSRRKSLNGPKIVPARLRSAMSNNGAARCSPRVYDAATTR